MTSSSGKTPRKPRETDGGGFFLDFYRSFGGGGFGDFGGFSLGNLGTGGFGTPGSTGLTSIERANNSSEF